LLLLGGVMVIETGGYQPRVSPSGRNGNCLPLRLPGDRIGGRQKGTPNKYKTLPEIEAAVIAAADGIGTPKRVGKIWIATGEGGSEGFFVWVCLNYPKVAAKLFGNILVLQEESDTRLQNKARASLVKEVLKVMMIPVELKPSHKTAPPSCVLELLERLVACAVVR
jgi:hypothetical protein